MKRKLNDNLIKLVTLLNDGRYYDGTYLGERLNMTRSAIWKAIKKLQNLGIQIDSVKGKGYALLEPLVLIDQQKLKQKISNKKVMIDVFETLPSTNDYLKSLRNEQRIRICLAESQTQGKGRWNRQWHSPFGKNIYLSCSYPFRKDISELAGLSLVTSLSIIKTLKQYNIFRHLHVKWPNDIVYQNKKLSGSLVEIQGEINGINHVVIGIGVNVNMTKDADKSISQSWTSLQHIMNEYIDRNEFCSCLINHLLDYLYQFNVNGFSSFTNEWAQADCLANQMIVLKTVNEKIRGKVTGINDQGHLLLRLKNGKVQAFSAGDASIEKK